MKALNVLFTLFFIILFIMSGWGLPYGRQIGQTLTMVIGFVSLSSTAILHKKIKIPRITVFFLGFLVIVSLSTLTAVNITQAVVYTFYYMGLIATFLYAYNNQLYLQSNIPKVLIALAVVTLIYGLGMTYVKDLYPQWLIPPHGYQLVYPYVAFLNHHPLGVVALIVLPFLMTKVMSKFSWMNGSLLVVFLTVLIFSYLRSAYVAFFVGCIVYLICVKKLVKKMVITTSIMFTLLVVFLLGISSIGTSEGQLAKYFTGPLNHINLYNKSLINGRDSYFHQAFLGIQQRPLTGYGSGNFPYVSEIFSKGGFDYVETSLNVILDIVVENGIIAGGLFLFIVILIGYRSFMYRKLDTNSLSFLMLYFMLLVLFQFHYYHRVEVIMFIFFLTAGIIYKENRIE